MLFWVCLRDTFFPQVSGLFGKGFDFSVGIREAV